MPALVEVGLERGCGDLLALSDVLPLSSLNPLPKLWTCLEAEVGVVMPLLALAPAPALADGGSAAA